MGKLKKVGIGIGITITVFFVIVIAIGVSVTQDLAEQTEPVSEPTIKEIPSKSMAQIGQIVEVAGIAYKVRDSPTTSEGTYFVRPDGIYFKIPVTIENLRKQTASVSIDNFLLIDEMEREYDAVFKLLTDSLGFEDVQPNLPINRSVIFDIPYDENLEYKLLIKPDLFEVSSDEAIICIKNC